ncbi:MAG: DPP IV N-terminal domain-containing protein [Robiginitomaculum sp.]|nr:DPP IV N-terminal domain-containing protein [Robiginitomaculum sp.]
MRLTIMSLLATTLFVACSQQTETPELQPSSVKPGDLTAAIIHSDPALSGPSLRKASISPNGKMVTVLQGRADDAGQQDLWAYDLATGERRLLVSSTDLLGAPEILSAEEKNRRERMRETGKGIVAYSWDSEGKQILFPLGGDVFVYNLETTKATQITNTDGFETDARISASGEFVSYVRDNDLYMTDLTSGRESRLSFGANELVRNATASFVVQEELARSTGYWLSPTETHLAYSQIDESPIAVEHRIEYGADGIENIAQRYPFAGTDNATVKLAIKPLGGGDAVWADIGDNPDIYLARVYWSENGKHLYVGILSRDHKSLKMLGIDPTTGASEVLFEETSKTWINMRGDFKALKDGGFLWSSERSGFWHIYRYDKDGKNPVQITKGNWPVSKVNCIDETAQRVYFTGWQETALEQHIYSIGFDGENLIQLSKGEGVHNASFANNCTAYIGTFSNKSTPPQTRAYKNDGTPLTWLNENKLDADHPYAPYTASHVTPEFGQLAAADGTMMDYMLYKPADIKPGEKRAAITIVYGGPGVQRVNKGWNNKVWLAQMLVDNGFVVFQVDNRGASKRGKAFEDHLYRSMGITETIDQSVGAEFLKALPYVDGDNMGVYGWSYGGYMALHMLAQTDHYKAGVSGAPVTDWALYDTAYTERYLGDPRPDNANYTKDAYENASVFAHLDGLTEPFLLIHGMADDNVVFRHSIKLMNEMQKRGVHNMRVMTYPGEKHGFRSRSNQIHRDQEILNFFVENLNGE